MTPTSLAKTLGVLTIGLATLSACSKSSSSSGDKSAASADPSSVALAAASADAPKAVPNSTVIPPSGAGPWDHHCDIAATHTCVEWGTADKNECDAAKGTFGSGPCMRTPLVLGTCVLATGKTSAGDPAPVKRILYLTGAGGAMKTDNAHAMCDRESLPGVTDVTHMFKDGPAARGR